MSKSLYLIDVSALAHRSYYAFINRPLVNSKGEETSAIFGFVSHILRLLEERKPTHIAFVKDLPKPTFRHALYEEYKAHRRPIPDGLARQLSAIDEFVELSGLRLVAKEGFEADDVIATLATWAREKDFQVYIVSRDKDLMQMVGDSVFLFDLGNQDKESMVLGADEVQEKMGVAPEKIADFLALTGDSSDNVPGVAKIGPKTATELIEAYGDLEGIYGNLDTITRKAVRENLLRNKENAFLSHQLVVLDRQVPLDIDLDDLCCPSLNVEALLGFLAKWELHSLVRYLPAVQAVPAPVPSELPGLGLTGYECITNPEGLKKLVSRLRAAPALAVDTETSSLDRKSADLVGLCFSDKPGAGFYVPVGHTQGPNLSLAAVRAAIKPILADPEKTLIFHNAKFDLHVLARHGFVAPNYILPGRLIDTMVAAYLVNPGIRKLSLADLSLHHFNTVMIPIENLIGKGKQQKSFAEVTVDEACPYGAEDADMTFRLWDIYKGEIQEKGLGDVFFDIEMPLLPVLAQMERTGVTLDVEALKSISLQLTKEIERLEAEIFTLAGGAFNVNSPLQLSQVLFEKLGMRTIKKTKTGFSTDAQVLAQLEGAHPIVSLLLDHRECTKLQNTYVDAFPHLVDARTGRLHTTYSQVIAATGRLSSVNPNLQNIPIRTEQGRSIRKCFTSGDPERVLLCADYSQIELRLLAHLSGDPALVDAYRRRLDIHARTAAILYGIPEEKVTSGMRRNAKVVNFGVLYGMGAHRLAFQLGISRASAVRFIENYFATFSHVGRFMKATIEKARSLGYVETLSGRKRYLPELASSNRAVRENAERIAANTPIQGSAADLIKIAMIRIDRRLARGAWDCRMLLQVHDELVFETAWEDAGPAMEMIKKEMEGAMTLSVPLEVEISQGRNWLEAKG